MKRVFDFLLASFGLLLFFIPGAIFALLIKSEDGGTVFYPQERWGQGGKKFQAYKFRSMVQEAHPEKPAGEEDERITKTGKFLRATAMDELPQLINIWKGDMSFVGPRALATWELDPATPNFSERQSVRPGLTGTAQIYAPRDAGFEEKFKYDLDYVRNHNLWRDIRLITASVWITLRGKWECRGEKL